MATNGPDSQTSNVVLTGFMGTGKTTVGRLLAKRLGMEHLDTDAMIQRRFGPIVRIFEEQGEEGFRQIEREIAAEIATDRGFVMSTGGKFMLDPVNAKLVGAVSRVFCLTADPSVILERVNRFGSRRPMLVGATDREATVRALLLEREPMYSVFEQVATSGRSPSQVVDEIVERLKDDPKSG